MDAVLSGETPRELEPAMARRIYFGLPRNYFLEALEPSVARAFEAALSKLSGIGAKVTELNMPELDEITAVNARGGLSAPEAFALHRRLGTDLDRCDPLVAERIRRGEIAAADYLDLMETRADVMRRFEERYGEIEAILCPTVPITAPEIAALQADPDEYRRVNYLLLRNASVVNFLDRCAITIPCHRAGEAPVGLMLIGRPMDDFALLSIALAVERALAAEPRA
jgi:aspartyl-tRNA(Asn)/glutamyl-tRNA(Gln) amidotransferase subunit A